MKVIKSLKNIWILIKETTTKITFQEGWFLNFLRSLMTADLSLMKSVLIPLAKTVLLPFALTAAMSATDTAIQNNNNNNKNSWITKYSINNFKWWNGRYHENS